VSGSALWGGGSSPSRSLECGDNFGQLRARDCTCVRKAFFRCVGYIVREDLDKRPVGDTEVFIAAASRQVAPASKAARAASLASVVLPMPASPEIRTISRPSPAATRLNTSASKTASASRPITPITGPVPRRDGDGIAPAAAPTSLSRSQADLECLDGLGQSLELDRSSGEKALRAASTSQRPHEIGGQDLAAVGLRAQTGRLDHASPK